VINGGGAMTETLLETLTQFGAAGLIGVLWLAERRHAAQRNRQLDEAHQRIVGDAQQLEALLTVVKENTRAISRLERSQRQLASLLERLVPGRASRTE
jgi:hypothetical protein